MTAQRNKGGIAANDPAPQPNDKQTNSTRSSQAVEPAAQRSTVRSIRIDPEFKALIPPLSSEEKELLEKNLIAEGCIDPLILWNDTLLDGHNRFDICRKHDIRYQTTEIELKDRSEALLWIVRHQLGRRNLTDAARIALALRLEPTIREEARKKQKAAGGDPSKKSLLKNSSKAVNTRKALADAAGVSEDTFAKGKAVLAEASPEVKADYMAGKTSTRKAHEQTKGTAKKKPKAKIPKLKNPPQYPIRDHLRAAMSLIKESIRNNWDGSESDFDVYQALEGINVIFGEWLAKKNAAMLAKKASTTPPTPETIEDADFEEVVSGEAAR